MTSINELKEEAKNWGFYLTKSRVGWCTCHCTAPNEACKRKNGKWKCVDKYEYVYTSRYTANLITHCRKKEAAK